MDKMKTSEEKQIIVCGSNSQMLKAEALLRRAQISTDLVPTPSHLGSICSTSILIGKNDSAAVEDHIGGTDISYRIYDYQTKKLSGLMKTLMNQGVRQSFLKIMEKLEAGEELSKDEIVRLLDTQSEREEEVLLAAADRMRREIVGDRVEIRAAIEFSNYCKKNCHYCGIRKSCATPKRYRMTADEILAQVHEIHQLGIKTVILQSGEDDYYNTERLIDLIRRIKQETAMAITLSIGERSYEEYRALKRAGANNYLLKIETTNPKVFKSLHPDDDLKERMECTRWLKELGYVTASGNMVGLPGQSLEDIAQDIIFFKEMGIHMIGIGPFVPAKGTPLEQAETGNIDLTLRTVAVTRLVCKNVYLPATTALASADPEGQVKALKAGANTIMLISTPLKYRESYQLYSNKNMINIQSAIDAVKGAGRLLPKYLKWRNEQ